MWVYVNLRPHKIAPPQKKKLDRHHFSGAQYPDAPSPFLPLSFPTIPFKGLPPEIFKLVHTEQNSVLSFGFCLQLRGPLDFVHLVPGPYCYAAGRRIDL